MRKLTIQEAWVDRNAENRNDKTPSETALMASRASSADRKGRKAVHTQKEHYGLHFATPHNQQSLTLQLHDLVEALQIDDSLLDFGQRSTNFFAFYLLKKAKA